MSAARITGAALLLVATPAAAAPLDFSATVDAHVGYAINPRLESDNDQGTGYGGITIAPVLSKTTSVSQTTLGATYSREQYFSKFGDTQSVSANFNHNQTFSEYLRGGVTAAYSRSNNLLLNGNDVAQVENYSLGGTTSTITGGANLAWQATAKDSFTADGTYIHQRTHYSQTESTFDEYIADVGYLHALNARTKIGLRTNVTFYNSPFAGNPIGYGGTNSRTIGPAFAIQQVLSPAWNLDADVGVLFQHTGGIVSHDSTGLGFHVSLCGTHPRSTVCFTAARQSSGTSFGGLRQQLSFGVTYTYRMTELSTLTLAGTYSKNSDPVLNLAGLSESNIFQGNIDYNRKLSTRWSVGVEARGGYLTRQAFGSAHSVEGSAYLRVKIG